MRPRYRESLCEGLDDNVKYTSIDIANTINQLSKLVPDTPAKPQEAENNVEVLEYIKKLEGFRIRLREIHWSTERHAEHVLTDNLMGMLTTHEDEVAEVSMGLFGVRIKVGQVVPTLPEGTDVKSILSEVFRAALDLKTKIEDNPQYSGLANVLDDCLQQICKGKYLETLL